MSEMMTMLGDTAYWLQLLIVSLAITWTLCMFGVVFAKTGRSPFWALALLVPYFGVLALWALAYARWPRQAGPDRPAGEDVPSVTG